MTLRRKMGLQISAMLVGLLLTVAACLWGLNGLRQDYSLALEGYQELRQVYEVGSQVRIASSLLASGHPDRAAAMADLQLAAEKFQLLSRLAIRNPPLAQDSTVMARVEADDRTAGAIDAALAGALRQLRRPPEEQSELDVLAADTEAVDRALSALGEMATQVRRAIQANQRDAQAKRHATILSIAIVSAAAVVGAILLGLWQYRGVMLPLNQLRDGVRRVAAGHFAQRLTSRGGEEFASLAADFNRMAEELDGFYHQLEQKVARKSRELVRSERLASVGFLAAGVAHEINNPLGIISGYAEYMLEQLKQKECAPPANGDDELVRALQVICDEAFRCKDITAKLLSLARQGDETRHPVNLADVADQVAGIVSGLRSYADRKIAVLSAQKRDELVVLAVEAEMKQVVLNLTINALEAVDPHHGQITIDVNRRDGNVQLSVSDDGRGMTPQTLERIFEPFFTEKRGVRQAGTGLGLSITHAIIEDHGGQIHAQSDGPGRGSRFTVEMPAMALAGGKP